LSDPNYITASCVINEQVVYKNGSRVFKGSAENLPGFLLATYQHLGIQYPRFHKMDNLSKLGWLAAELLLDKSMDKDRYPDIKKGIVLSNASASLDTDLKYFETTKTIASPALFVYTLPNIVTGEICIRHHFKGENAFFITENFDAVFMQQYVNNLINNNILQACICGWVELLDEHYKTVLFLVEKGNWGLQLPFTAEIINKTYQSENG